jgi:hypothetical protein
MMLTIANQRRSSSLKGDSYAQGVKANVLFFDRKPGREEPWTQDLWIYDLRTNQHFTLKQNPLTHEALGGFIKAYSPDDRHARVESERFRRFTYDELMARDKASLDTFWLRDESLEDTDKLPPRRHHRRGRGRPGSSSGRVRRDRRFPVRPGVGVDHGAIRR